MSNIYYNWSGKKRVRQLIGSFYASDLDGTFDEAVSRLFVAKASYLKPQKVIESDWNNKGQYLDGSRVKTVTFDTVTISLERDHDDSIEFRVYGERDYLPEELEAEKTKEQRAASEEKENRRKLFDKLKKEFEKDGQS